MPIALSGKQRKAADRDGGIDLILPWPPALARPAGLGEDEERDANRAERAAAASLIGPAAVMADLVVTGIAAAMLRRPTGLPGSGQVQPHLVVRLIGRRWYDPRRLARRSGAAPEHWYSERVDSDIRVGEDVSG